MVKASTPMLKPKAARQWMTTTRRIEASFADVERRQLEQLQRVIAREAERHAEAAAVQFEGAMKGAREEAAGRLSRELDRAVETFVRQADAVFAERLAQTGDAGQQRLEQRQRQAHAEFERQRDELLASFADRIAAADAELRRTLGAFAAEAEAERATLAARLAEESDPSGVSGDDTTDLRELAEAVDQVRAAEARVRELVARARANDRSWGEIAIALGVSRQAARERFVEKVRA